MIHHISCGSISKYKAAEERLYYRILNISIGKTYNIFIDIHLIQSENAQLVTEAVTIQELFQRKIAQTESSASSIFKLTNNLTLE